MQGSVVGGGSGIQNIIVNSGQRMIFDTALFFCCSLMKYFNLEFVIVFHIPEEIDTIQV